MALVQIKKARGTWMHLFKPQTGKVDAKTGNVGDSKYNGNFIIDADSQAAKDIRAAMEEVAVAQWGDNGVKIMDKLGGDKRCLRDGDDMLDKEGNNRPEFEGKLYVVASNKTQPGIFHKFKDPETGKARALTTDDGTIYGGCYVNVQLDIYAMDKPADGIKGVFATLRGVQFSADGERLSGNSTSSADEFDAEDGDAEDAGF